MKTIVEQINHNTRFIDYYNTLRDNRKQSAVMSAKEVEKGYESFVSFHILDALHALLAVNEWEGKRIIDIGSGAGIPGIPLYIYKEEDIQEVTLLEATSKKAEFLTFVKKELCLNKLRILNIRAEEAAKAPGHREEYDISLIRAVGNIAESIEISLPFVKPGGVSLIYMGTFTQDDREFSTTYAENFGGKLENTVNYLLQDAKNSRNIVVLNKQYHTDEKYPRKASKIGSKI